LPGTGFGHNPFGSSSYGEWEWSRYIFWDLIPEDVRSPDVDYGGYLELYMDGIRGPFDRIRIKIKDLRDLRDPLNIRTQYDETTVIRLGDEITPTGPLEQQGIDGVVQSFGTFKSETASFNENDRGKLLEITRSTISTNNQTYTIAAVISPKSVVTEPLIALDTGPLHWEMRALGGEDPDIRTFRVVSGDIDEVLAGWLLDDGKAEFTIADKRRFNPLENSLYLERYGRDGSINGSGNLEAAVAPFLSGDTGKRVTIKGMVDSEHDGQYQISRIVTASEVELIDVDGSTAVTLPLDAGPLEWTLLPFPELDVTAPKDPLGFVEQGGVDLRGNGTTLESSSAAFTSDDVGKIIEVLNSALGNDGLYEIVSVTTENEVEADSAFTAAETDLLWRLRAETAFGDGSEVQIHAPTLLQYLAQDFGIEIDRQFSEIRQRSWVRNVSRWVGKKGTAYAYELLCAISGFDATTSALYRITADFLDTIPTESLFDVLESGPGKSGTDGTLSLYGGRVRFTSPTANFGATDDGLHVRIRNAATAANNAYFTISDYIDANTVQFRIADTVSLPDANNGSLLWSVVRLYADLAPTLPRYDHVNVDLLNAIVSSSGTYTFRIDKYCWEDDWSSDVPLTIINVSAVSTNLYDVTVTHNTGAPATGSIGFGTNSTVNITAVTPGSTGNLISIEVRDPSPSPLRPLTVNVFGTAITVNLATDAGGNLDPSQNRAVLVQNAINAAAGALVTAAATGTGAAPLVSAELLQFLTGGQDVFLNAPEVVVKAGNWLIVDGSDNEFWLETVPIETATGPPPEYTFQIYAPVPPTTGDVTLRYACEVLTGCWYCPASYVRILAELGTLADETGVAVERVWERLLLRLEETTPAHVTLVVVYKQILEATIGMTAEIDPGYSAFETIYAPFTVYADEVPIDFYPVDTVFRAEVDTPSPKAIMRGVATMSPTGRVV